MRLPDAIQQDAGGRHAKVVGRLRDHGQRRIDARAPRDVVERHEADVFGHAQRGVAGGAQSAHRHQVVGDEHGIGAGRQAEQRRHGLVAAVLAEIGAHDERRRIREAGHLERLAIALLALDGDVGRRRPANERDALPAKPREVQHGGAGAFLVGDADQVHVEAHGRTVDGDDGHALAAEMLVGARLGVAGHEDQTSHFLGAQRVEAHALARGVAVGVGEQQRELLGLQRVLDAAHEAGEERVLDVGDDDADGVGGAGAEVAGDLVGPVLQLAHGVPDALRELAADELGAREHARDSGGRDVGLPGDLVDRGRGCAPGLVRRTTMSGATLERGHAGSGAEGNRLPLERQFPWVVRPSCE